MSRELVLAELSDEARGLFSRAVATAVAAGVYEALSEATRDADAWSADLKHIGELVL